MYSKLKSPFCSVWSAEAKPASICSVECFHCSMINLLMSLSHMIFKYIIYYVGMLCLLISWEFRVLEFCNWLVAWSFSLFFSFSNFNTRGTGTLNEFSIFSQILANSIKFQSKCTCSEKLNALPMLVYDIPTSERSKILWPFCRLWLFNGDIMWLETSWLPSYWTTKPFKWFQLDF